MLLEEDLIRYPPYPNALAAAYSAYNHSVGALSVLLDAFTFYLLIYKSDRRMRQYRLCLLLLQTVTALWNAWLCIGFCPMGDFVRHVIYCTGIACERGVPLIWHLMLMLLFLVQLFTAYFTCILYRHQAVMPFNSRWHLATGHFVPVCLAFNAILLASLPLAAVGFSAASYTDDVLSASIPSGVQWLALRWTPVAAVVAASAAALLAAAVGAFVFLFLHMKRALKTGVKRLSGASYQRRAMMALMIQIAVPSFAVSLPIVVAILELAFFSPPPAVLLAEGSTFSLHSIANDVVLIWMTRPFREFLLGNMPRKVAGALPSRLRGTSNISSMEKNKERQPSGPVQGRLATLQNKF